MARDELLERVEDTDDVAWLKRARGKVLHYRPRHRREVYR